MEDPKKPLRSNVFSNQVMENLRTLTEMSMDFYTNMLDNVADNSNQFSRNTTQLMQNALRPVKEVLNTQDCCPPKNECPPHCIASISRKAMLNEQIVEPFRVRNNCSETKTYRIGIRELLDQDGNPTKNQPTLNKTSISLQPHTEQRVMLQFNTAGLEAGMYTAEIVLREKEYNQNICFTLHLEDSRGVVATPFNEQKFKLRWQSWQSHYYCEPKPDRSKG